MTEPFISSDVDLAAYLRLDLTDDDLGVIAVDAACEVIRGYTGQVLNKVTDDEISLDGTGTDALLLPQLPVTSVTTVVEDDTELVVDTDYVLGSGGVLYRLFSGIQASVSNWCMGRQNVDVTYTHGYDLAGSGVPSDIRIVAVQIAARIYDTGQVNRETIGSYNVEYVQGGAGLTAYEKNVCDKYRVRRR